MSQYIVWISATDHYRDKHAICLKRKKQNYFTKRIKPELIRIIMYVFSLQKNYKEITSLLGWWLPLLDAAQKALIWVYQGLK